jgi:hypothetical protein
MYHQTSSMAEILNKECQMMSESELDAVTLKLSHYTHPFPYRLSLFDNLMSKVVAVCPYITVLNVVTDDTMLETFALMTNVKRAQIELEDCFGLGLYSYLEKMGKTLEELVISCSSG